MSKIKISIIIATKNREEIFLTSLEEAAKSVDKRPAEIIVINDGDTELIIPEKYKYNVQYLMNFQRGVSVARNWGAREARGDIFFFVDDDMWINKEIIDWILTNSQKISDTSVTYNVNWIYPPHLVEELRKSKVGRYILTSEYHTAWGRMHQRGKVPEKGILEDELVTSGSFIISKKLFEQIGGYNEAIIFQGEDRDLTIRLKNLSVPIYRLFDVTLFHNQFDRIDLSGFLSRVENGYKSQFIAENQKIIPSTQTDFNNMSMKKLIFEAFLRTEKIWINILKILPNKSAFDPINNRLIDMLSGLHRYKAIKKTAMAKVIS